jgi:hypothetical protein
LIFFLKKKKKKKEENLVFLDMEKEWVFEISFGILFDGFFGSFGGRR